MKEDEYLFPTNFLFSISPDGRIESIKSFGGNAEGDDEAGVIRTLFEATLQTRKTVPDLDHRLGAGVMVSIFADGRFEAFRVSNTPLEKWTPNQHKSQNVTLMAAVLGHSESQTISDAEIARDDPEAEKTTAAPQSGKNWSNPRSPNGNAQVQPAKFTGWFGNAKKIPLAPTDENYKEKSASLIAAGFSFSDEEELWVRP